MPSKRAFATKSTVRDIIVGATGSILGYLILFIVVPWCAEFIRQHTGNGFYYEWENDWLLSGCKSICVRTLRVSNESSNNALYDLRCLVWTSDSVRTFVGGPLEAGQAPVSVKPPVVKSNDGWLYIIESKCLAKNEYFVVAFVGTKDTDTGGSTEARFAADLQRDSLKAFWRDDENSREAQYAKEWPTIKTRHPNAEDFMQYYGGSASVVFVVLVMVVCCILLVLLRGQVGNAWAAPKDDADR